MQAGALDVLRRRAAATGLEISTELESRLLVYFELLLKWNRTINLTSVTDPEQAIDRMLIEPVAAAAHLPSGGSLADLGSGGGSPAIPLALALASHRLLMVESRTRKAAFLREAAREVGLNASVAAVRFEELLRLPQHRHVADIVSVRAVRTDRQLMDSAQWLARPGGTIALFASESQHIDAFEAMDCSTWNITPSAILMTFHVKQSDIRS